MSEYQYYEFRAIDRPLTDQEIASLRAISGRAHITSASFVNVYNYGDFRGDPEALMEKVFDAFLYVANWGTHSLMLRLPKRAAALRYFRSVFGACVRSTPRNRVSCEGSRTPDWNYDNTAKAETPNPICQTGGHRPLAAGCGGGY